LHISRVLRNSRGLLWLMPFVICRDSRMMRSDLFDALVAGR
jgi:hypothetical protein